MAVHFSDEEKEKLFALHHAEGRAPMRRSKRRLKIYLGKVS